MKAFYKKQIDRKKLLLFTLLYLLLSDFNSNIQAFIDGWNAVKGI